MAIFLVILRRTGPKWNASRPLEEQSEWQAHAAYMDELVETGYILLGGPLADEDRVVHAVEAENETAVRRILELDPWFGSHLRIDTIDPWTIRLDGRLASSALRAPASATHPAKI